MQDWSLPLVIATAAFLAAVLWRVRPAFGRRWGRLGKEAREALRQAHARIEAAKDDHARALALCDAADLARGGGKALYLRAIRADPASTEIVDRAVAGLWRRPRALEDLLWRHLAHAQWTETSEATRATLDALRKLYAGRLRDRVRAEAVANAMRALAPKGADGSKPQDP